MRTLDEDRPHVMTMFCEDRIEHEAHQWSEVPDVHCYGYPPPAATEDNPDENRTRD